MGRDALRLRHAEARCRRRCSAADIIAWCRANLAHYKAPRTVVFGPLPKTSTGKIQKYALREQAKDESMAIVGPGLPPIAVDSSPAAGQGRRVRAPRASRRTASVALPSFDIAGQVALVTGASSGIGEHFAEISPPPAPRSRPRRAAPTGLPNWPTASRRTAAPACRSPATSPTGTASPPRSRPPKTELGPLSILVNNAGVVVSKPFFEHTEEDWDYVVDTNLKGAWLMAREFAHHLVEQKRPGRIINISSILGFRTIGRVPAYCAAKAGLTHLTHVLAMELARYGILVNALAPGYIETDFNRDFFQTEAGKTLIGRIPLKRIGQAPDLDGALLFLASPASAYVTGAVISVDGGHGVAAI